MYNKMIMDIHHDFTLTISRHYDKQTLHYQLSPYPRPPIVVDHQNLHLVAFLVHQSGGACDRRGKSVGA